MIVGIHQHDGRQMRRQAARAVRAEDGHQLGAQRRRFPRERGHRPKNASDRIVTTVRTGCSTFPVEKRASADSIVSTRSSIVRTDLTSDSVSRRKRSGMS